MIEEDGFYKEKDVDERILTQLTFHSSKKNSFPILISQELSEKLINKYGNEEIYFEIDYLNPDYDKIFFLLNNKNVTDSLNVGGISVLDCVIRDSGIPLVRQEVEIKKVNSKRDLELKIVEISLPEVNISPRDLWYYERSLVGKILYSGVFPRISYEINQYLPISILGMERGCEESSTQKKITLSGLVTVDTNFIVKPRSMRIIIIINISREFFCFASNGFPWWRGIIKFFDEYLNSNNQLVQHHYITIVLMWKAKKDDTYMDYYRVFWEGVLSQITLSQTSISKFIEQLRRIFISLQKNQEFISGLANYYESSILESINLALTQLQNDLIDGSLVWTGRNIKLLSPGPPIIISDLQNYQRLLDLSKITEVRFLKTFITCHFISFTELDWYNTLNIYIVKTIENIYQETLKVINLNLPINISYFKIENTFYNDYNSRLNISSTITLLDEYINCQVIDSRDYFQDEESDIDLILSGKDMVVRNISNISNNKVSERSESCSNYSVYNSLREFYLSYKNKYNKYINNNNQSNRPLVTLLLPLTTSNLNKIDIEKSVPNSEDLIISESQRTSNWTLTPRSELFLVHIWKNYHLKNPRLINCDFGQLSLYFDQSEYKDINIEILRLILYDLIVHRLSMSFQISTLKYNSIISHYNSEMIQMLKYYNSQNKSNSLNYYCIHQMNLLKDDNNIIVEVIDAIVKNGNNSNTSISTNTDHNESDKESDSNDQKISEDNKESDSLLDDIIQSNQPQDIESRISKSEIINYKYEYLLYRGLEYNNSIDIISQSLTKGEYIKCYTIFNNLSNVNFSTLDEILVWQREIPFIDDLINESYNELLNYNIDKSNLDYYYLLTSYISGLSISYIHFAFIPYIKINDSNTMMNSHYKTDFRRTNSEDMLRMDEVNRFDQLDCYSNYYKDCCLSGILENWINVNSVNNAKLKELFDFNIGKMSDECFNMKNLKKISENNIKSLIKSLQSFFFKNAPPEFNNSLDIEIMDDNNYFKNQKKSIKVLYSWCESFEYIKEEYEAELGERYREVNFISNNDYYNNANNSNFEPISWFVIYFDSLWHPILPFKFSIGWLTCPSIVISRVVRKLKQILLKFQFTLIQLRSSDIYLSYEVCTDSPTLSSYTPFNPPYLIRFNSPILKSNMMLLLKRLISYPLSLQPILFEQSNSVSRLFLAEPHSLYILELNQNSILIRMNYYQHFWKHNFQYDSFPILKCPCSGTMFDHNWRTQVFYYHLNHIKEILIDMQIEILI
ncbi:putative transmembrane domain-containing protein [Cryptosporidium canis]|uniref:Transmembrane domain-containing protein n=1 Tax=Cryptosporidium canis TaxID=195482 RepID=A0ABQ8P1K8_9CRYT|nr:putative transmembrane domain-containing protein [Cryptosporidium canis]